ncbi:MAG TPA: STAS domain-containing protein [Candidatus Brocadiia bacterium]|nr:STAS domain-containing protein [Candidatus Brocadiia bacterium]
MVENYKTIEAQEKDGVTIMRFKDTKVLDELSIRDVGLEMLDVVARALGAKFIIDLAGVEFLSSAVLGKLIKVHQRVVARQGRICLCGVRQSIMEVFQITNLDKLFEFHESVEAAMSEMV